MIDLLLQDPELQSSALPLLLSLLFGLVLWLIKSPHGGLGVVAALFLTVGFVSGWPNFPPATSTHKVHVFMAFFGIFGLLIAKLYGTDKAPVARVISALLLAFAAGGLALPIIQRGPEFGVFLPSFILIVGWLVAFIMSNEKRSDDLTWPIMLMCAAFGVGTVALIGASASIAQAAFASAAAIGGYCLLNWPKRHFGFGPVGVMGVGGFLMSLSVQLDLYTRASSLALLPLLGLLSVPYLSERVQFGPEKLQWLIRPGVVAVLSAIWVVGCFLIAQSFASEGPSGY